MKKKWIYDLNVLKCFCNIVVQHKGPLAFISLPVLSRDFNNLEQQSIISVCKRHYCSQVDLFIGKHIFQDRRLISPKYTLYIIKMNKLNC